MRARRRLFSSIINLVEKNVNVHGGEIKRWRGLIDDMWYAGGCALFYGKRLPTAIELLIHGGGIGPAGTTLGVVGENAKGVIGGDIQTGGGGTGDNLADVATAKLDILSVGGNNDGCEKGI